MGDEVAGPSLAQPPRSLWRRLLDAESGPGAVLLYALVAAGICFWRLGSVGLVSMEGIAVDGARRMLESGEWLVPRVYGELYTYKPAFAYWLASLSLRIADPPSEALLRLPFAAGGFVMGLVVLLWIGRLAGWRAGLLSGVASVSGVLFLQKARMAEFDVSLAAGVGVAVAAACYNLSAARQRWGVWALGYLGLAVGFLTKGPLALVFFGPGVLAAGFVCGRLRRLFGWRHLSAALVFVAIAGSYLWAVWETAGPEAFRQPLVESKIRGIGGWALAPDDPLLASPDAGFVEANRDDFGRGWRRALVLAVVKPVSLWAGFLPWTVLLLPLVGRRPEPGRRLLDRPGRAAAAFVAAGLLMFLLIPTFESRYFLPFCAPIGILCGVTADGLLGRHRERARLALGAGFVVAAVFALATVVLALRGPSPPVPPSHRWALGAAGVLVGVALVRLWRGHDTRRLVAVLGLAALCALLTQVLAVEPYRAGKRDLEAPAVELAGHLPAGEPVWVLGPADAAAKHSSLFFYLDRPIRAFRPATALPPPGASCLFTARDLERLQGTPGFRFRETGRVEHVWWSYRVGVCSEPG